MHSSTARAPARDENLYAWLFLFGRRTLLNLTRTCSLLMADHCTTLLDSAENLQTKSNGCLLGRALVVPSKEFAAGWAAADGGDAPGSGAQYLRAPSGLVGV